MIKKYVMEYKNDTFYVNGYYNFSFIKIKFFKWSSTSFNEYMEIIKKLSEQKKAVFIFIFNGQEVVL